MNPKSFDKRDKFRVFDASLYDEGICDLFNVEDFYRDGSYSPEGSLITRSMEAPQGDNICHTRVWRFPMPVQGWALVFDIRLTRPPTDALRPIIPDNACTSRITAAASYFGTKLAGAYSSDTVIYSSLRKGVYEPRAMDSVKKSARPALGSLPATQEKFIHLKYYHEFIFLTNQIWQIKVWFNAN